MKAIVVELKNDIAAVLSDDGCIKKIKNKNYEIGQVIQLENPRIRIPGKLVAFAASAAACIILGTGAWAYASPYTYISVDVNPSVEFTANRFDRIIRVKAVNDDGEKILNEISINKLKNETISDAIINTVEQISDAGYFDHTEEGGIVIATSSENQTKADNLAEDLKQSVEQKTAENGDSVEVKVFSVSPSRVKEAKELGATPGKLNLVEKLQAASNDPDSVNIEEWLHKPVKDIMKATKEYTKNVEKQETRKEEIVKETPTPEVKAQASNVSNNKNSNSNKQDDSNSENGNQKKDDNKNKSVDSTSAKKSTSQTNSQTGSSSKNKKDESKNKINKSKNSEQTSKNANSSKNNGSDNVSDEAKKSNTNSSADNTPKDNKSDQGGNNSSKNAEKKDESTKDKNLSGSGTPDKSTQQQNESTNSDTSSKGNSKAYDNTDQNGASDKNASDKSQNNSSNSNNKKSINDANNRAD